MKLGAESSKQCSIYYAIENVQTSTEQIFFNHSMNWTLKTVTNKRRRKKLTYKNTQWKDHESIMANKRSWQSVHIKWKKKQNWISKQYENWTMNNVVQCMQCNAMHYEQEYYVLWFICFFHEAIDASIFDSSPFKSMSSFLFIQLNHK